MKVITSISGMKDFSYKARKEGKTIGFVPTMGSLHEGHLSLVRAAKKECDVVIMSIFVNKIQFCPDEDFDRYPRDIERDKRLAESEGVNVLFVPSSAEMYPPGYAAYVEVTGNLTDSLCGTFRPGHFRGVTTVVAKLFNICMPHISYFGQKDAQQAVIVKKMAADLDMPVTVRVIPIVREKDGLAMSSRNTYLSEEERQQATAVHGSLNEAEKMITGGELSAVQIKMKMTEILTRNKDIKIDYIEIVDGENLKPLSTVKDNTLIAVAAFVGETRLIDNIVIKRK